MKNRAVLHFILRSNCAFIKLSCNLNYAPKRSSTYLDACFGDTNIVSELFGTAEGTDPCCMTKRNSTMVTTSAFAQDFVRFIDNGKGVLSCSHTLFH